MNWEKAISLEMVAKDSSCQLIIVGETEKHLPFCYEESFDVVKVGSNQFTVSLSFGAINPLEKLKSANFIEMSFRDKGVLYFSFVQLLELESMKNKCILTLSAPEEIQSYENRRFNRVNLSSYTPITCRIVGVRTQVTHKGISFNGELLDISGGGLSIITGTRLFFPLFLQLNFTLPNIAEPFNVYGEIMRVSNFSSDSYRIAVELRNISENTLNKIDQYCKNK